MMAQPEVWLRGPIADLPWVMQPVVHAFMQVSEDVGPLLDGLTEAEVWTAPHGAASVGFHCRHLIGSTDRLLTYARGEALSSQQMQQLKAESLPSDEARTGEQLAALVREAMQAAIAQVAATAEAQLPEKREVGRARLPTTVVGLVFHAAEHATRHAGQLTTTVKIVRGMRG